MRDRRRRLRRASATEALQAAGAEVIVCDGRPERAGGGRRSTELGQPRGHAACCSRAARPSRARSSTPSEVDELRLFIAPIVIGGAGAQPLLGGAGAATIAERSRRWRLEWERIGGDLLVRARLREW